MPHHTVRRMHSSVSYSSSLRLHRQSIVYEDLVYLDVDPFIEYEQEDLVSPTDHDEYELSLFYLILQLEELAMEVLMT